MALSLAAVAMALPRAAFEFSFDYQGVYVAIFAALVTLLIGWQIYNIIGINRQIDKANKKVIKAVKEIEKLRKRLQNKSDNLTQLNFGVYFASHAAISYLQGQLKKEDNPAEEYIKSFILTLRALKHLLNSDVKTEEIVYSVNFCIASLERSAKSIEDQYKTNKQGLLEAFDPKNIDSFRTSIESILGKINLLEEGNKQQIFKIANRQDEILRNVTQKGDIEKTEASQKLDKDPIAEVKISASEKDKENPKQPKP